MFDRMKRAFFAAARAAEPRLDYFSLYHGRVVAQSADLRTVDVQTDDPRLPEGGLGGIPLRGEAGMLADLRDAAGQVNKGVTVLVGWENGDPSRAFACLFGAGAVVRRRLITATDVVVLGAEEGAEPAARGTTLQDYLGDLATKLAQHIHPASSGTTSPSAQLTAIAPPNVCAAIVKVK